MKRTRCQTALPFGRTAPPPPVAITIVNGDALKKLKNMKSDSIQCCVTSPPYWGLRDYETPDQIGAESELPSYITALSSVFEEVRRVLKPDGTLWLNIGDCYTSGNRKTRATDRKNGARKMIYRPKTPDGLKEKDLIGVPWRIATALRAAGWYLRSEIIWYKPNCQPESVRDRPTKSHEQLFLFSKSPRYLYNYSEIKEPARGGGQRNRRTVWMIPTVPFRDAHFATFPPELVELCVKAGSNMDDTVLDPFFGSGTVGEVCQKLGRNCIGIELNPAYVEIASKRIKKGE